MPRPPEYISEQKLSAEGAIRATRGSNINATPSATCSKAKKLS